MFDKIVEQCFTDQSWISNLNDEDKLAVFRSLRILLRDGTIMKQLQATAIVPLMCEVSNTLNICTVLCN